MKKSKKLAKRAMKSAIELARKEALALARESKISTTVETIGPKEAQEYLDKNNTNRKLRAGVVEKYATDMRNGTWTACVDPIVFYENGDIASGQHRLWAIIESQTVQTFDVKRHFPLEAALNLDVGLTRSLVDNAHISGADPRLTNEIVSVARAVDAGIRQSRSETNSVRLAAVAKHRNVVEWAVAHGPTGRSLRNQCMLAAVARAAYTEKDWDKLARFGKVLSNGQSAGLHESAAVTMRNYLLVRKNAHLNQAFRETFLKAQNAIWYFMRGKQLLVIKEQSEERYPLPEGV